MQKITQSFRYKGVSSSWNTYRRDCCRTVAWGVMGLLASRRDPFQPQSFLLGTRGQYHQLNSQGFLVFLVIDKFSLNLNVVPDSVGMVKIYMDRARSSSLIFFEELVSTKI